MALCELVSSNDATTYLRSFATHVKLDSVSRGELLLRERIAKLRTQLPVISILETYCSKNFLAANYVGGMLRDMLASIVPRDIDLVVPLSQEQLLGELIKNYGASKNRMGGHKLDVYGMPVDIWCIENSVSFARIDETYFKTLSKLPGSFRLNTEAAALGVSHPSFVDAGMLDAFDRKNIDILHPTSEEPYRLCEAICRTKNKLGVDWEISKETRDFMMSCAPKSVTQNLQMRERVKQVYRDDVCLYGAWVENSK